MKPSVKQMEETYRLTYRRLFAITFVYTLVVAAGIAMLIAYPKTANWVAQSVQAEFVTADAPASR